MQEKKKTNLLIGFLPRKTKKIINGDLENYHVWEQKKTRRTKPITNLSQQMQTSSLSPTN